MELNKARTLSKDILKSLCIAVKRQRLVALKMEGGTIKVEPYAVGHGHDGKLAFSAYLVEGAPLIKGIDWIYCAISEIKEIQVQDTGFVIPRNGHSCHDGRFIKFAACL